MKWNSLRQGISIETEPMPTPSLEFSIVSGANEDLIVECLRSLYNSLKSTAYVWKVTATCNNAGTVLPRRLREEFPGIDVIQNNSPRGFASNHNVVLRRSSADYVWILNDDLIFSGDAVAAVTEFMEAPENARVAVVSPRLNNTDGSLQPSTYSFSSMPQTLLSHSGIREHRVTESIVAALIDHESTLKTLLLRKGKAWLRAENPRYPDLIPAWDLQIQGVARAVIRHLPK